MERLTERKMDYCQLMDCGITCTQKDLCDDAAIYNKLRAYEDAEEQGSLVRLPCKVGDTVFRIWNGEIEQYQVVSVWFNDHIKRRFHAEGFPFMRFCDEDIGKRVFLTRKEAEAALTKEG